MFSGSVLSGSTADAVDAGSPSGLHVLLELLNRATMPYDPLRHGPHRIVGPGFHERVYTLVKQVPRGRLSTYGDIAEALGLKTIARQVGNALSAIPEKRRDIPWHRIVNRLGQISARGGGEYSLDQRALLQKEGLSITQDGRVMEFQEVRFQFGKNRR